MGNSTTELQDVFAWAKAKGIPVPTDQPGGYGTRLAIKLGNDVLSAIVAERFNPKWNRAIGAPFYTNSYQQDYPQVGLVNVGWLEEADRVDINNTAIPKPTNIPGLTVVRQLSRTSQCLWPANKVCWMYNQDLSYGAWPGPNVMFNALVTTGPVVQNPLMTMKDINGNLLVVSNPPNTAAVTANAAPLAVAYAQRQTGGLVTLFVLGASLPPWLVFASGQHGTVALVVNISDPQFNGSYQVVSAAAGYVIGGQSYYGISYVQSNPAVVAQEAVTGTGTYAGPCFVAAQAEGSVTPDGTVQWMVVAPMSQGFRVYPLPSATGPVYQITVYYQMLLEKLLTLYSLINPIPDDQNYIYQEGIEIACKRASSNPALRAEALKEWPLWMQALTKLLKQNDREIDAYDFVPSSSPVESVYDPYRGLRNPQDPGQPY
jgi:hypothetical protein